MRLRRRLIVFMALVLGHGAPASASQALPPLYTQIAAQYAIPEHLLYAVASQESSRPGYSHPWPWTANIGGDAHYYSNRAALYQSLRAYLKTGKRNFDVGLMQINWRYNAHLFNHDLWLSTNPIANLRAGARLLHALKQHYGSFERAVGVYHGGTPDTAAKRQRGAQYRERVRARLKQTIDRGERR